MTNKSLDEPSNIMREIGVLVDRAILQIVNAMRHTELNKAGHEEIRKVDQLTRALEYLCDVEEYNKVIEKKLYGLLKTNRKMKKQLQIYQQSPNPELDGFRDVFALEEEE